MFATLFLGVVLAVFLTLGVVTGDAERGLLQPLVVRPIGRSTLLARAVRRRGAVCVGYVLAVYFVAVCIIGLTGHWWPDSRRLAGCRAGRRRRDRDRRLVLGSVLLSSTANGIVVFMLFGGGLVAGLLGSIGHALNSHAIKHASTIAPGRSPSRRSTRTACA